MRGSWDSGRISDTVFRFVELVALCVFIRAVTVNSAVIGMLPVFYGLLFIIGVDLRIYFRNPGLFVAMLIATMRYFVLPILLVSSSGYVAGHGVPLEGVILMVYEELCLGIALRICMRLYKSLPGEDVGRGLELDRGNRVLQAVVVLAVLVVIVAPGALAQFNFILAPPGWIEIVKPSEAAIGIVVLLLGWARPMLPLLMSVVLIRRYQVEKKRVYYYLTIAVLVVFNVLILTGSSRNSAILPGLASIFFLMGVFPENRVKTFSIMFVVMALSMVVLTQIKLNYTRGYELQSLEDYTVYAEAHFAGPSNLGAAIGAKDEFQSDVTISTLGTDLFGNVPGLGSVLDLENRTTTYYNLAYYGGGLRRDQVLPFSGQAAFYTGYLFIGLPILLVIYAMALLDRVYRRSKDVAWLFFSAYFSIRFGMAMISNASILLGFIYQMVLPVSAILYLNWRINTGRGFPGQGPRGERVDADTSAVRAVPGSGRGCGAADETRLALAWPGGDPS